MLKKLFKDSGALNFCSGTITCYFEMIVKSSINLKTEAYCNPIQEKD